MSQVELEAEKEHKKMSGIWWHILPPLLFIALMLLMFPIFRQFEFNNDEGYSWSRRC